MAAPRANLAAGRKVIVIGGGFGGIAAGLRARALGYEVTLLDRLDQLGGRGRVVRHDGFHFDAGPTVITAPFLLDELFALFGEDRRDHVPLLPVTPFYRVRFVDGRHFDLTGDADAMRGEVVRFCQQDLPGYEKMQRHSAELYRIGYERYSAQPFHKLATMMTAFPEIVRLSGHRSVYSIVRRYLRDDSLRRVFSLQPLLVGGHPFHTSGLYALIQHLERTHGVWFPKGGTGALVAGLGALMRRQGIAVRLQADVARLLHENGRITGVALATGETLPADAVIANADAPAIYADLLPSLKRRRWTDRKLDRLDYSMGLFVFYFGTNRRYETTAHHTILLGQRYRELLDEIFGRGVEVPDDLSLYLHRPTATDPDMAPPGCDAFYVLAPVPNLRSEIDWAVAAPRLRDRLVAMMEARELPELSAAIVTESWMTPQTFSEEYRSRHGAGFSVSPRLMQSAWFRFHNKSEEVRGLYLVGAGTHPGAGLPGVLTSAKVVETLLKEDAR
ncbi:phytoene desaturase family protein [Acidisoma sp.]|uniref:phytoene desaturase family protein n=1 Tax=Acidisoma sp. TaxID=1872115 RepID=UPI003AFFCB02